MSGYKYAPRPTTYKGIEMRSRLEARVAAELDTLPAEVPWSYEPRAFADETGQYLPDFMFSDRDYVEVRPTLELAYKAMARMRVIWSSEPWAWLHVYVPDESVVFVATPHERVFRARSGPLL